MRIVLICILPMLLLSCGKTENSPSLPPETSGPNEAASSAPSYNVAGAFPSWELLSSGEGTSITLATAGKQVIMRLFCPSGADTLNVNVQSFRPISSEERLTVGSGKAVVTLVAAAQGDPLLGGVSGAGEIPDNLEALINGQVSANYGAQNSGPHAAPPQTLAKAFVTACNDRQTSKEDTKKVVKAVNACLVQDGKPLAMKPRRAIGTEPFWGAKIEGRCVHYAHVEDQTGTRIWTRYARNELGEVWSGVLKGQLFELEMRNETGCSDGMSDKRYPLAVSLKIGGTLRIGCAEPG